MEKTIKKIGIDDLDRLGIIFTENDIIKYGIVNHDKVDLSDMLIQKND
jgi:hypothetical protein